MFTIYGIRIKGHPEARYIGQTAVIPDARLAFLLWEAAAMPRRTLRSEWLLANRGQIEAFEIAGADTRQEARMAERQAVRLCLALGHRLFNRQLVPAAMRLPQRKAA